MNEIIVQKFFEATREDSDENLKIIKDIIDTYNFDVDYTDENHNIPAISEAIENNCIKVVKLLIDNGANVLTQIYDFSYVRYAAQFGYLEIVQHLLEKDSSNINNVDISGHTPLMKACKYNHISIVKYLLSKGADINYQVNFTITALTIATAYDHIEIVKLLIENGAQAVIKTNITTISAMIEAIVYDRLSIVKYLFENNKFEFYTEYHETLLIVATRHNKFSIVKYLVDVGINIDDIDRNGYTALMYAAEEGFLPIMRYLLAHGSKTDNKKYKYCKKKYDNKKHI